MRKDIKSLIQKVQQILNSINKHKIIHKHIVMKLPKTNNKNNKKTQGKKDISQSKE